MKKLKNNEKAISTRCKPSVGSRVSTAGITLIALVITIIVLIILAGVSISIVLGNNGIITRAKDARTNYLIVANEEQTALDSLYVEMNEKITGQGGGGDETPKGPNGKPLVNKDTVASTSHDKIVGEDALGNQVVVPDGFKIAEASGTTVKVGIVIEDSEGNQYVWVPVSNINHDGSNKIKVDSVDEEGVEITLGRYTFDSNSPGNPTLEINSYQYANSYATPVTIVLKRHQELKDYRQSNYSSGTDGLNTTAKNLQGFVESVRDNKGYYIARYEASYRTNGKAGSIQSRSSDATLALTSAPSTRKAGDLWNFVKQGEATEACYGLYTTVNSDLMNSYAWDTAIVYIQAMGNTNYANANDGNGTLRNTGATGDEKCKIFDMAGNEYEWTTEYSTYVDSKARACVARGGYFYQSGDNITPTGSRFDRPASADGVYQSFRPTLYL